MLKILKNTMKESGQISVYANINDTSKFLYGKILCADEDWFSLYMVSCDGTFDGIIVKPIESIIKIETDGQYDEKMKKLCNLSSLPNFPYKLKEGAIKVSVLQIALETRKVISLELLESGIDDVVGIVEDITDEFCKIKQIDQYGMYDGFSFVKINDITQISYDSQEEKTVLKLYEVNQGTKNT